MTGLSKLTLPRLESHLPDGLLPPIRLAIQSIISYQTSVVTPILLIRVKTLLVSRPTSSTSLLQREMQMMKNGLYQKLTPNSNCFKLTPKLAESHFLPGRHLPIKASRKTISSPILDHRMSISTPPTETSLLPKRTWVTNGTGPKPEHQTRRITLSPTSEEMLTSTTPSTTLTQLKATSVPGTSQKTTGSDLKRQS